MTNSRRKWDTLSDEQKAKRELLFAGVCAFVVVFLPVAAPLDNIFNIICATIVSVLGITMGFAAGGHAESALRERNMIDGFISSRRTKEQGSD